MTSLTNSYAAALAHRESLDSPLKATIGELVHFPAFSGFVETNVGGLPEFNMFICARDDLVALRLFWLRAFEPMSSLLWVRLCQDAQHVADIGAHSGYYSLLSKRAKPSLTVTSFEPHPIVFARLLVNLRANGLDASGCVNQAVVADNQQTVELFVNADVWAITSGSSTVQRSGHAIPVRAVNVQNLTRLFGAGPDLIKMDVEGAEQGLISALADVNFGAVNDMLVEQLEPWSEATEKMLKDMGWNSYKIDETGMSVLPASDDRPLGSESRNLWLTRRTVEDAAGVLSDMG